MNKVILAGLIGILVCFTILAACSEEKKKEKDPVEKTVCRYKCPMECTGEIFNKPGKCPNCGTELIKITEG
jgi:hypothetical protein